MKNFYSKCAHFVDLLLQSPILLMIRLIWGWQFLQGGIGKFENIDKIVESFNSIGIVLPTFSAYLVASIETIGGALLILGFLTRLTSIFLAVIMVVALSTVHHNSVMVFLENQAPLFAETAFIFLIIMLIILAFGPGFYSLDRIFGIEKRQSQPRPKL
jgi:putative oxidoreductase